MIQINHKVEFNHIILLFLISLSIFIFKWFFSYYFFQDDISIKIIFDTPIDSHYYYIYTEALSSLNFNNSFDPNIKNLDNLPLPFFAVLTSSILLSLFGFYSILITELFFIFVFLLIFFLIFQKFEVSKKSSILLSLILLTIPSAINFFNLDSVQFLNNLSNNLFGLGFVRPLVVNSFLYIFLLHLINLNKENTFNIKNFIIIGLILSFSFTSFYYFFILKVVTLLLFLLYKFKLVDLLKFKKIKLYLVSLFVFLIASSPFIYFLITSDNDYKERLFLIDLDSEKKIILLDYLLSKLLSLKFILIFLFITFLNIINNLMKIKNADKINIFYVLFISSILSPLIFIILSNKTTMIYHFINLVNLSLFFYIFFFIINLFLKLKIRKKNNFINSLIVLLIIFYNFNVYKGFKDKRLNDEYSEYRQGIYEATKILKKIDKDEARLLTFDSKLMVWAILNNIKHINVLSGQMVPKKHHMIENDLINNFKFLQLNADSLLNFFENKIYPWRLYNPNTQLFFWGRYSASTLRTYNNSKNFNQNELATIRKTTPLNIQSIAIPRGEFIRLRDKFINFKSVNYKAPNLIVLNFNNKVLRKSYLDESFMCKEISSNNIKIFVSIELKEKCKKNY